MPRETIIHVDPLLRATFVHTTRHDPTTTCASASMRWTSARAAAARHAPPPSAAHVSAARHGSATKRPNRYGASTRPKNYRPRRRASEERRRGRPERGGELDPISLTRGERERSLRAPHAATDSGRRTSRVATWPDLSRLQREGGGEGRDSALAERKEGRDLTQHRRPATPGWPSLQHTRRGARRAVALEGAPRRARRRHGQFLPGGDATVLLARRVISDAPRRTRRAAAARPPAR